MQSTLDFRSPWTYLRPVKWLAVCALILAIGYGIAMLPSGFILGALAVGTVLYVASGRTSN